MNLLRLSVFVVACASSSLLEAQQAITMPQRRPVEHRAPPVPALPANADDVKPATITVLIQGQPGVVLRTRDRILVKISQREWLFERNSVDPRRVSAKVVDHPGKRVIGYEESDVRNLLGLNGWAEVLQSTSHLAGRPGFTIGRVNEGVDLELLKPADQRFPEYKMLEVTEWLEDR
jgi:hypothetical protein